MTSDDLFWPEENSPGFLGVFASLPAFSWWVDGTWLFRAPPPKPPHWPGVYVFTAPEPIPRWKGESDIVYIGATGDLRKRLSVYVRAARRWPDHDRPPPQPRSEDRPPLRGGAPALEAWLAPRELETRC